MLSLLTEGDAVSRAVALALLIMSVATWVLILWKTSLLWRASRSLPRSLAAFWQAADLDDAEQRLQVFDSTTLLLPPLGLSPPRAAGLAGAVHPPTRVDRRATAAPWR